MLLITEQLDTKLDLIKESVGENGKKNYFIEGVFLMGDKPNKNGRLYSSNVLAKEAARYTKELIEQNRAYGELGHPTGPTINLDRVSHMIKSLVQEGSDFVGKAKITIETPMGAIVKNLLDEEANLGVSSRGLGSLKPASSGIMEVQDDFRLATAADIVADPSAGKAFVRGIMENVNWVWDVASNSYVAQEFVDESKRIMKKQTVHQINENSMVLFEKFLSTLVEK